MSKVMFLNTLYNPEVDEEIKNWEIQQSLKDHYWKLNNLDKYDYALHKKKLHDTMRKEIHIVRDNK
jgi:hypothetical protein